ncbi:MAG: hypothetical protein ACRCZO_00935 [Cetobacterium sp.]
MLSSYPKNREITGVNKEEQDGLSGWLKYVYGNYPVADWYKTQERRKEDRGFVVWKDSAGKFNSGTWAELIIKLILSKDQEWMDKGEFKPTKELGKREGEAEQNMSRLDAWRIEGRVLEKEMIVEVGCIVPEKWQRDKGGIEKVNELQEGIKVKIIVKHLANNDKGTFGMRVIIEQEKEEEKAETGKGKMRIKGVFGKKL